MSVFLFLCVCVCVCFFSAFSGCCCCLASVVSKRRSKMLYSRFHGMDKRRGIPCLRHGQGHQPLQDLPIGNKRSHPSSSFETRREETGATSASTSHMQQRSLIVHGVREEFLVRRPCDGPGRGPWRW